MDKDISLFFSCVRRNDLFYLMLNDFTKIVEDLERIVCQALVNGFILKMVFIEKSAVQSFEKEEGELNREFLSFGIFRPTHFMTCVRIHDIFGDKTRYIFRIEIH